MRRKPFRYAAAAAKEVPRPWRYFIVAGDNSELLGRRDQNGTVITAGKGIPKAVIMEVFDGLPQALRISLSNSNHDWAPHWADEAIKEWSLLAVIERVERADREEILRREMQLLAGAG